MQEWWRSNRGARDPAASVTRMGIFMAILSVMPLIALEVYDYHHKFNDNRQIRIGCRWLGELLALIGFACSLRGRGWMRLVLAVFCAWLFALSFWLMG